MKTKSTYSLEELHAKCSCSEVRIHTYIY